MLWHRANQKAIFSGRRLAFGDLEPTGHVELAGLQKADVVGNARRVCVVEIEASSALMMASKRLHGWRLHHLEPSRPEEAQMKTIFTHSLRLMVPGKRARWPLQDQRRTRHTLLRRLAIEAIRHQAPKLPPGEIRPLQWLLSSGPRFSCLTS